MRPSAVELFRNAPASGCRVSVELRQAKGGAGSERVRAGVCLLCIWHCECWCWVPKRQGSGAVEGAHWICLNANGFALPADPVPWVGLVLLSLAAVMLVEAIRVIAMPQGPLQPQGRREGLGRVAGSPRAAGA